MPSFSLRPVSIRTSRCGEPLNQRAQMCGFLCCCKSRNLFPDSVAIWTSSLLVVPVHADAKGSFLGVDDGGATPTQDNIERRHHVMSPSLRSYPSRMICCDLVAIILVLLRRSGEVAIGCFWDGRIMRPWRSALGPHSCFLFREGRWKNGCSGPMGRRGVESDSNM